MKYNRAQIRGKYAYFIAIYSFFCNLDIGFEINPIKAIICRGYDISHIYFPYFNEKSISKPARRQLRQGPVALQKNKLTMDGRLPWFEKKLSILLVLVLLGVTLLVSSII